MGLMLNRRRVMGGNKLPYDAEIEYLESTGTQYIDTGYKLKSDNVEADMECSFGLSSNYGSIIYSYKTKYDYGIIIAARSTGIVNVVAGNNEINTGLINKDERYELKYVANNGTCVFYRGNFSKQFFYQLTIVNNVNIKIFYIVDSKLYYLKLYDNNLLALDLIPVRVGQVGYLYDKVSGQLFGNSGTGSFILGPDKDSTVIITQQQQREMYGE